MFKILNRFCDESVALLAVALTFFHSFSIEYIATFHTTELQFITPIIIIYLFINLSMAYSTKKNILFSIIVGILMLAKQNHATYLAVLGYSLLERRFKEVGISIASYALPLILGLLFLKFYGLKYYDQGAELLRQGVWLYEEFIYLNPIEMFNLLLSSFNKYLQITAYHFSIWFLFAIFAVGFLKHSLEKKFYCFFHYALSQHGFKFLQLNDTYHI